MAWLSGFNNRTEITIDSSKIDSALTDFPIFLNICVSAGISTTDITSIFDNLQNDSNILKIAVTTSDGTTQCYTEIEYYDFTEEKIYLYSKIPTVASGTDTTLYFYWDSTASDNNTYVGITGSTPGKTVWDDNYGIVLHMNVDTDIINAKTGVTLTTTLLTLSKESKSIVLNAADENAYIHQPAFDFGNTFSIECSHWINPLGGDSPSYDSILGREDHIFFLTNHSTVALDKWALGVGFGTNWYNIVRANTTLLEDVWYNLSVSYQTSSIKYFLDGVPDGAGVTNAGSASFNTEFYIFHRLFAPDNGYRLNGKINELRISTTVREEEWFKATSETLNDNLLTFGVPEAATVNIDVTLGEIQIEGFDLNIKQQSLINVTLGEIQIEGFNPNVIQGDATQTIDVGLGEIQIEGFDPTISIIVQSFSGDPEYLSFMLSNDLPKYINTSNYLKFSEIDSSINPVNSSENLSFQLKEYHEGSLEFAIVLEFFNMTGGVF